MDKPNSKQYKELKEFKKRLLLEIHNAGTMFYNGNAPYEHKFKIGNSKFRLYPDQCYENRNGGAVNKFSTTKW